MNSPRLFASCGALVALSLLLIASPASADEAAPAAASPAPPSAVDVAKQPQISVALERVGGIAYAKASADTGSDFSNGERSIYEHIGNAELRRHKHELRLPISGDALEHRVMRPLR